MSEINESANRQIVRAAGTVMLAFVASNLAGLLRQILVANAFGTQAEMEAFNAANRVAETLFNLAAGGALSSAFIPTLTALLAKNERQRAWKLASSIANLVLFVTIAASVIAAIFAPWIVRNVLAPGFAAFPEKEALTIALMRLMLPSAVIFGLSGLLMGILNSHQVFLFPALAPAMYQIGMIFGVTVLSPSMGIYGLAWGVLIGASLHLLLQVPSLARLRGSYLPTFGLETAEVREVARLMGPRLLGVAIVQLNFWINTRLASQFIEGSVTGVTLAFTLMLMPQAAIAQSIAIAALPTFSAQVAQGKMAEMRHSLASSLRGALLLSIPASLGLIFLRVPIVQVLYQRGEFDEQSTALVSWALLWYAAGLVGHCLVEILSRAFYSFHDTKTPVLVGIGAMSLNIFLSYLFSGIFTRFGWMPHGGLALANSVATGLEMCALLFLIRRRLMGIEGSSILDGAAKTVISTIAMGVVLYFWSRYSLPFPSWMIVLGGIALGGSAFIISSWLLKTPELQLAAGFIRKRLAG